VHVESTPHAKKERKKSILKSHMAAHPTPHMQKYKEKSNRKLRIFEG